LLLGAVLWLHGSKQSHMINTHDCITATTCHDAAHPIYMHGLASVADGVPVCCLLSCCSMGCITVITLLSFPRLQYVSDSLEAGRFWLALLVTWLMFYMAVLTGFGAFLFSGLATYNQLKVVLLPAIPGMLIMLVAFWFFCLRFSSIHPGWTAVKSSLFALVAGADVKDPDAEENVIDQLMGSDAIWQKLQCTVSPTPGCLAQPGGLPGASSGTPLPSGATPICSSVPAAGEAAMGQAAGGADQTTLLPQPPLDAAGLAQPGGLPGASSSTPLPSGATPVHSSVPAAGEAATGHAAGSGSSSRRSLPNGSSHSAGSQVVPQQITPPSSEHSAIQIYLP
jgi:hypothetical protein